MSENRKDKKKNNETQKKNALKASEIVRKFREEARQIHVEAKKSGRIGTMLVEATKIALEAKEADSAIDGIYWFPHDEEVHLIMIDKNLLPSGEDTVDPFYFDSTSTDPVPSGIAIIGPEEYRRLKLPQGWGDWDDGKELY